MVWREMEDYEWKQLRAEGGVLALRTQTCTYFPQVMDFWEIPFRSWHTFLIVKKKLSTEKITAPCGERLLQVLQLQRSHHKHALCYPLKQQFQIISFSVFSEPLSVFHLFLIPPTNKPITCSSCLSNSENLVQAQCQPYIYTLVDGSAN